MTRDKFQLVFAGVAGFAAVMEAKVQQLSVERAELIDKVSRLEAIT